MIKGQIRALQEKGTLLFYNSEGNPEAFKLMVRHISFGTVLKVGKIKGGYFVPSEEIYLVDFENNKIEKTNKEIKIIPLQFMEESD